MKLNEAYSAKPKNSADISTINSMTAKQIFEGVFTRMKNPERLVIELQLELSCNKNAIAGIVRKKCEKTLNMHEIEVSKIKRHLVSLLGSA